VITPGRAVSEAYRVYAEYPTELWNKLTDEQKRYLVTFTQNYDAAYFSSKRKSVLPVSEKCSAWNRQQARRRDAMIVGNAKGAKIVSFLADDSIGSYTSKTQADVHDANFKLKLYTNLFNFRLML
jgi:hypothetical protein